MTAPQRRRELAPRRSSEDRQTQIAETVIALSAERIPGQITTQDIANAIGFTQGALFRHFPSKEAIWLAAIEWLEGRLLGLLESAAKSAKDPLDGLRGVFFSHVDFAIARPGVPRLVFNELQQPAESPIKAAVRQMLERHRRLVRELLDAAAAQGQIDRHVDRGAATTLFVGTIQGLVMQSMLAGAGQSMRRSADQVFPLFLRSLEEVA